MEKKKVSQLNDLFEKMLSSKLNMQESTKLGHLYNEFFDEGRENHQFKKIKPNANYHADT